MKKVNGIVLKLDLTGFKSGKLTAKYPIKKNNMVYWSCNCECGNTHEVRTPLLSKQKIKSCGCLKREVAKSRKVHGKSKSNCPIYRRWADIKQRCLNSNNTGYRDYGGRGITICDEWKDSFQVFYDYFTALYPDYLNLHSQGYQIDRIDNDGNYEPGNIRFVPSYVNNENKERVYKVDIINSPTDSPRNPSLVGNTYSRLKVVEESTIRSTSGRKQWLCRCSCGNECLVQTSSLKNGSTKSCGCLKLEKTSKRFKKRGLSNHPLRAVLVGLIQRCHNPNNAKYHLLGGKGIKVCDEWRDKENGLGNFYDWAVGSGGWHKGLCIDRVDTNKDFSPGNCQFIPRSEKARKQDTSRFDKSPTK